MNDGAKIYATLNWDEYSRVRPAYPAVLYDEIFAYHGSGAGQWNTTLDVGAGNGIAGPPLLQRFHRYVGSDLNELQVNDGRKLLVPLFGLERAEMRIGAGEDLAKWAEDLVGQVDLVACGEAVHWLDDSRFVDAAYTMVRPGGTLAIWFYGPEPGVLSKHPRIKKALEALLPHSLPITPGLHAAAIIKNSKLDAVSAGPFADEKRIRWELPASVEHPSEDASFLATQPPWTDRRRTDVDVRRPAESKDVALQRGPWGLSDVRAYIVSLGSVKDILFGSPAWTQVEEAFAEECADGQKDVHVGWSLTLLLARRPH